MLKMKFYLNNTSQKKVNKILIKFFEMYFFKSKNILVLQYKIFYLKYYPYI